MANSPVKMTDEGTFATLKDAYKTLEIGEMKEVYVTDVRMGKTNAPATLFLLFSHQQRYSEGGRPIHVPGTDVLQLWTREELLDLARSILRTFAPTAEEEILASLHRIEARLSETE